MSGTVRRRAVLLALLVSAWTIALGCFPVFTPMINRKCDALDGSIHDEFSVNNSRLYITGVEEHAGLRRYHLALTGLLADRDQGSTLFFTHDEVTGQVAIVRESRSPEALPVQRQEVQIIHRHQIFRGQGDPSLQETIARRLTTRNGLPSSICVDRLHFGNDHIAIQFLYRDQFDIIRTANLVVLPRALHQSPVLSALMRLNYVWSIPADVVVVVVGWTTFLFWGPFVL